jgi:hypothetical protein
MKNETEPWMACSSGYMRSSKANAHRGCTSAPTQKTKKVMRINTAIASILPLQA